jgi:ankyrin repeat protein
MMGQGTPRDPARAGELLMRAAQQGHAPSQLAIGYLAARGYGVERDLSESLLWLTLAAEAGNEAAARAAEVLEPHLSPEQLIRARREMSSWRASLGTSLPTPSPGGNETPKSAPLQEAISAGNLTAVHSLLARGEDADGRDVDGRTALINAGWRGDRRIANILIEVGADPDVVDNEGKSALIWAASNGHTAVVAQLAAAGTELDLQDDKGLTALMRATWNGYTDVVELLVKTGADKNLRDRLNMSALDYAKRQGNDDIIAVLGGAP